jgi:hypothetical protein
MPDLSSSRATKFPDYDGQGSLIQASTRGWACVVHLAPCPFPPTLPRVAANMDQPCPADPLSHRWNLRLRVTCPCGHSARLYVGDTARRLGLAPAMRLWRLAERLTCSGCGKRGARVAVG